MSEGKAESPLSRDGLRMRKREYASQRFAENVIANALGLNAGDVYVEGWEPKHGKHIVRILFSKEAMAGKPSEINRWAETLHNQYGLECKPMGGMDTIFNWLNVTNCSTPDDLGYRLSNRTHLRRVLENNTRVSETKGQAVVSCNNTQRHHPAGQAECAAR